MVHEECLQICPHRPLITVLMMFPSVVLHGDKERFTLNGSDPVKYQNIHRPGPINPGVIVFVCMHVCMYWCVEGCVHIERAR